MVRLLIRNSLPFSPRRCNSQVSEVNKQTGIVLETFNERLLSDCEGKQKSPRHTLYRGRGMEFTL